MLVRIPTTTKYGIEMVGGRHTISLNGGHTGLFPKPAKHLQIGDMSSPDVTLIRPGNVDPQELSGKAATPPMRLILMH